MPVPAEICCVAQRLFSVYEEANVRVGVRGGRICEQDRWGQLPLHALPVALRSFQNTLDRCPIPCRFSKLSRLGHFLVVHILQHSVNRLHCLVAYWFTFKLQIIQYFLTTQNAFIPKSSTDPTSTHLYLFSWQSFYKVFKGYFSSHCNYQLVHQIIHRIFEKTRVLWKWVKIKLITWIKYFIDGQIFKVKPWLIFEWEDYN